MKDIFDAYGKKDPKQAEYLARHAARDSKPFVNAAQNTLSKIEKPQLASPAQPLQRQESGVSKQASAKSQPLAK